VLVRPHGPFSLQASLDFLARFAPAGASTRSDPFIVEPHVVEGRAVTVRARSTFSPSMPPFSDAGTGTALASAACST
jgi:hypothetical protein